MICSRFLRTLEVVGPPGEPAVAHLSAASGLVRIGRRLFVVADDELSLGVFDQDADGPGRLVRLFEGELPSHYRARKAGKPDLEALTVLPDFPGCSLGALFAVGSGSKPNRQRAVLLALDGRGTIDGSTRQVDLAPLYAPLRGRFTDLNIEGLFVAAGELCLLQRSNRKSRTNACIRFDWHQVERWLQDAGPAPEARSISAFDLGSLDGVPLGFTDGVALPGGGWAFCAAAEDTSDSYLDGRCAGSAIGVVTAGGELARLEPILGDCKAEGIAIGADGDPLDLLLVTDADDRSAAAQLLSVTLPSAWLVQAGGRSTGYG